MPKTMTMWGAYTKLEALAAAAERLGLPYANEIRQHVEKLLTRSDLTREKLADCLKDWRDLAYGLYPHRTAAYLDDACFALLEYLDGEEVQLTGSALLDQLLEDGAEALVERETRANMHRSHLVSLS